MEVVLHSVGSDRRGLKVYGTDSKFWRLGGYGTLQQTLEDLAAEMNDSKVCIHISLVSLKIHL